MKWTDDQKKSIFAKPSEIVVSAAAGSGKTQVLTTRIIKRIKDSSSPVSVEKLLIVTFTKAAAAEMKERIGKALRKELKEAADPTVLKHLKEQLSLVGSAHICTIDSFCYDVVKQNFFKVNLPSDVSIGENGELSLLRLSALEETVNAFYCAIEKRKGTELSEENIELATLVETNFPDEDELILILNGFDALTKTCAYDKRDSEFSENILGAGDYTTMISDLYKKAQSAAYPEKWLNFVSDMYNEKSIDYQDTFFCKYAFETCKISLNNASQTILQLAEISEANGIGYEEFLRNESESLLSLTKAESYDELFKFYKSTELFPRITGGKTKCDKEIKSSITAARGKIRDYLKKKLLPSLLEFSTQECNALRNQLYPQIKALCSAAILLGRLYYEKMTSRKIIDFSTCEHLALNIISEDGINLTDAGISLRNKFDEIYIDEFQDSNDLQDMLFGLISKGRMFLVGDVKQSIYGFRNADPSIFMKKCDVSLFDEDAAKRKIFLSKNFRSGCSVIDGVNSIFDTVMTSESCSVDYKSEHRLDFGADFIPESIPGGKCELVIIGEEGNSENKKHNEALYIANEIKNIINSGRLVWDKNENKQRKVRYSDITVLARSLKSSGAIYEKAFSQVGIPCYVDGNSDLYETVEVGQILELLKLIDNAQNEIALACALRSPMFLFDENELLEIRVKSNKDFCDAFYGICSYKYKVSSSLGEKCRKFNNTLKFWRYIAGFVSVEELIRRIYTDTNIYSNVLSFPDGQLRRANLDLLLEKAEEFERSTYTGLFNFVNYVQKIKKSSDTVSEAKSVSEKMDVVRIMTIHKSKGLEFPIVFVAGCGRAYNIAKPKAGGLIMNSHGGIGMDVINPLLRCKYPSPMRSVLIDIETKDSAREEMRLLYVALTRAREKLYAVGTLRDLSKFEEYQFAGISKLTATDILCANSYFSLMALSFPRGADKYWNIHCLQPQECNEAETVTEVQASNFSENKEISDLLDYEYLYKTSIVLPNKASVSFLKSQDLNLSPSDDGNIELLNKPSHRKISLLKPELEYHPQRGAFFGTTHHKVFQHIDFNCKSVQAECDRLLEKGVLTSREYEIIDITAIEKFLGSKLGHMMKRANTIYREMPFVISLKAKELDSSLPDDDEICVQGVIDCYFEYEDKVYLVDYKTDYYNDPTEIAEKYKKQLYYYEKALKIKFKDKIIQKCLYLTHKSDIMYL